MRSRRSSDEKLPPFIVALKLKYPARCKCRRSLKKGQSAYYDTQCRRAVCRHCVRLGVEKLGDAQPVPELQALVGRINQLLAFPHPRSDSDQAELAQSVDRLRVQYAPDEWARRMLVEYYEVETTATFRCICLTYEDKCNACEAVVAAQTAAVWDAAARRIWCLPCASANCL